MQVEALFDVRVIDTDAPSHCHRAPLESSSQEKKRMYKKAVEDRRGTFTPFVLSVDGLLHKEASHFLKHMATALSSKWDKAYSITSGYIRSRLPFAGVQALVVLLLFIFLITYKYHLIHSIEKLDIWSRPHSRRRDRQPNPRYRMAQKCAWLILLYPYNVRLIFRSGVLRGLKQYNFRLCCICTREKRGPRPHALYFELFVSIGFFEKSAKPTEKTLEYTFLKEFFSILFLKIHCSANTLIFSGV